MAPDSWARAPDAANADEVLYSPGTTETGLIYAGPTPYDPISNSVLFCNADHGQKRSFFKFRIAAHDFVVIQNPVSTAPDPLLGYHQYQHLALDPLTGDVYWCDIPYSCIRKWDGTTFARYCPLPYDTASGLVATALTWFDGKLHWYDGRGQLNYSGDNAAVHALDAKTRTWTRLATMPNQKGDYHNIAVPTADGLIVGGGNVFPNEWHRLVGTVLTRMPDPPIPVGIMHGHLPCGDGKGKAVLVGEGKAWRVDAGAMTITPVADPPPGLRQIYREGMSCCQPSAIDSLGVSAWFQWNRDETKKASTYLYKPAQSSG